MFAFDKYLSPFLTPIGGGLVLAVIALILLLAGRRRSSALLLALTIFGLYVTSTPFLAGWLSGVLERQYPPLAMSATPIADVIIALGGATEPAVPPRQDPELNSHGDRLMHAADLYKAGKAKSHPRLRRQLAPPLFDHAEADDMREVLMRFGVPSDAILMEGKSLDTNQNAEFSAAVMRDHNLKSALLVTSGIHMPRAMATFRQAGVDVTASATDIVDAGSVDWLVLDWMPSPMAMVHTGDALHELAGFLYYRLRGRA